ncbi:MAG: TPM domain-containing protein [Gammaproteobacteria bacterium]|nr:TPM domain-containing protein [Gammaproteobacteria bacterium]
MNIKRIFTHLCAMNWRVKRAFPAATLLAIEHAIKASEIAHTGEIRFVVENALDGAPLFQGQTARERAIDVFSQLRIWDTEHNNGVLIYLLLADRDVEIIADRGIHSAVGAAAWETICQTMEVNFRQNAYQSGVIIGIEAITAQLVHHFPAAKTTAGLNANPNELSDTPVVL